MFRKLSPIILLVFSAALAAGEVDVVNLKIVALGGERFRIAATLKHDDSGWEHYANAWDMLDQNGNLLGTRILHHPHVNEQPFTRNLTLNIPAGVKTVTVRGRDSIHEYGGKSATIAVPK